jgi:serine protease AprX
MATETATCALCGAEGSPSSLAEAGWVPPEAERRLSAEHPGWRREDGGCPACVQHALLQILLEKGEAAFHTCVQAVWPLDAEAAFGAIPTPLRLHADPRFTGASVTLAMVDSAFYPHPDLVRPRNRIRAWVNAAREPVEYLRFDATETPRWPGWDEAAPVQWHGTMTSAAAAGNGFLSHGLYSGMGSGAQLVLVQVSEPGGRITNASITRALDWLARHGAGLGVQIVNLSLGGDPVSRLAGNPVDEAVAELVAQGALVVVAAGNDGERRLVPPATAPRALTVGGLDDRNTFDHDEVRIWHSNYGETASGGMKPELVAPSMWVVAPVLPGTEAAAAAKELFERRARSDPDVESSILERKLVTPHYQHVDGTSFASPLVASIAACMLEANPTLTPRRIRELLVAAAQPVAGAPPERQGAGAIDAGRAVTLALWDRHGPEADFAESPRITGGTARFLLHEHGARAVRVLGSWNGWAAPGLEAAEIEPGVWGAETGRLQPGEYTYKFLIDDGRWLADPANPARAADGFGTWNSWFAVGD